MICDQSAIEVAGADEGFKTRDLSLFSSSQYENVLRPRDVIRMTGCTDASPGGEESFQAIDGNTNTKYLNFCRSSSNDRGFQVATTPSVITAISMTTANDNPGRDPKNWKVRGSSDGGTSFKDIAQGSFAKTAERFSTQIIPFQNSISYNTYWVTFETWEDTCMQVAEVQLMRAKTYCDEPKCTQAVWDTNAGGHTCGSRISWVQSALGYSVSAACSLVSSEFPNICLCRPSSCSSEMNGGLCPNMLQSSGNVCSLLMQGDGNLVIYNSQWQATWASNTNGRGLGAPYSFFTQPDGNVVVYDRVKTRIWVSGTNGMGIPPFKLEIRDDCNLVLYDKYSAIWDARQGILGEASANSNEQGTCTAVVGVYPPREPGNPIHSVQVDGIVSCKLECMKRTDCVLFILNSATEGGTCKLYNGMNPGGRHFLGGNNAYGRCTKPSISNGLSNVYIMNAGVGGYLSTRDINPLMKRDGDSWERWTIVKSSHDGTKYNIKDNRGRYLSAQQSGLVEFRTWDGTWERWDIKRVSDTSVIIRGDHGMFLTANKGGWIFANAIKADSWEEWKITNNNDVKGEGPDGEFTLAGTVLIPVLIAAAVVAPPVAGAAATLSGSSLGSIYTASVISMVSTGLIKFLSSVVAFSLVKQGLMVDPKFTRVATAPIAHAALFEACLTETCKKMPCWGSNTRCAAGSTCNNCCNGSRYVWQWAGDHCW